MRYARRLGATLLAALAAASLAFLPAAPAAAGDPADLRLEVRQGNLSSQSGGQPATLVFAVTNDGPSAADAFNANVIIPFGDRGVVLASSNPSCNQVGGPTVLACPVGRLEVGQTTVFTLVIGAPPAGSLQPTEAISAPGQITIDAGGDDPNGANDSSQFTLNLTGAPPAVTTINGTVADGQSAEPIVGANVVARDVNGATCVSVTDSSGAFNCTPTQPLAGGQVTIEATMAGYQVRRTTVMPQNGTITGVQLALDPSVASASPTPSAAPSSAAPAPTAAPQAIKAEDGFPWDTLLLVLGIVAALGGLGALGWWVYQRKDKDPDDPGDTGGLPGLIAAESIMPTTRMRVPHSVLSETTVANQPLFGPREVPAGDATAMWDAPAPERPWVNRSTEPIHVSGAPGNWSGNDAGRGSSTGDRTAEWPTIDPAPSEADVPSSGIPAAPVSSRPVAPSDPTTAWPAIGDADWAAAPYARAAGPLGDQYASVLPAETPEATSGPAPSWGAPAQPAHGSPEYGSSGPGRAPLAGWDTPPTSMPAQPRSGPPMSGPTAASYPTAPGPMAGGPMPAGPVPPRPPTAQWPAQSFPASAPPAAGYYGGAPYGGYPSSAPPANYGPAPQWQQPPAPGGYPSYPAQNYPPAPPMNGPPTGSPGGRPDGYPGAAAYPAPAPPNGSPYGSYPAAPPPAGQVPPEQTDPDWSGPQYYPPTGQR